MRKVAIIASTFVVAIVVTLVFLLPRQQTIDQSPSAGTEFFDDKVKESIAQGLAARGLSTKKDDLIITKRRDTDRWIVLSVVDKRQPLSSEAYLMTYVVKKKDRSLELAAFSGDGFSQSSFSEPVNDSFIEELNRS